MSPRTLAIQIVAVAVVALLVYLRPAPVTAPSDPGAAGGPGTVSGSDDLGPVPFRFLHVLPLQTPPPNVLRTSVPSSDRVARWFDRLLWASPRIVSATQEQLATLDPEEQARYVERFEREFRRDAGRTVPAIAPLGGYEIDEAHRMLLEAATHTDNRVRMEATRALALVDSDAAAARLEKLLDDPIENVRRAALRALTEMSSKSALAALEAYAERNPEEGIKHALAKLGADADDPSVIPVLRRHVDRTDDGRFYALDGLARFGDGNALDRLYELIELPDPGVVKRAIQSLLQAPPELLDVDAVEGLVTNRYPDVRAIAAVLFSRMAGAEGIEKREKVLELLGRQIGDLDMRVRYPAYQGLFDAGRTEVTEKFLRVLPTASEFALHVPVEVLTKVTGDERALEPILARLETETDPRDRAILLTGVANLSLPAGIPVLLETIRAASEDEPYDGNRQPLSQTAALHLGKFGLEVQAPLLEIADDDEVTPLARMRALDALRAVPGADALDDVLEIALDPTQPREVRIAAIETLPHLDGDLYEVLSEGIGEFTDVELARRAQVVLFDYS
ncbi:MAG: HEAT repeat domain-containing protein [Planctomycetota bacterium JB042]